MLERGHGRRRVHPALQHAHDELGGGQAGPKRPHGVPEFLPDADPAHRLHVRLAQGGCAVWVEQDRHGFGGGGELPRPFRAHEARVPGGRPRGRPGGAGPAALGPGRRPDAHNSEHAPADPADDHVRDDVARAHVLRLVAGHDGPRMDGVWLHRPRVLRRLGQTRRVAVELRHAADPGAGRQLDLGHEHDVGVETTRADLLRSRRGDHRRLLRGGVPPACRELVDGRGGGAGRARLPRHPAPRRGRPGGGRRVHLRADPLGDVGPTPRGAPALQQPDLHARRFEVPHCLGVRGNSPVVSGHGIQRRQRQPLHLRVPEPAGRRQVRRGLPQRPGVHRGRERRHGRFPVPQGGNAGRLEPLFANLRIPATDVLRARGGARRDDPRGAREGLQLVGRVSLPVRRLLGRRRGGHAGGETRPRGGRAALRGGLPRRRRHPILRARRLDARLPLGEHVDRGVLRPMPEEHEV
mmetsp:Transcript_53524/g.162561  ORF Transcript_53524/g.162561 Transcript_53524/m.162561 type:complete len:466 (+) Transcript_53524:545-1942(+)